MSQVILNLIDKLKNKEYLNELYLTLINNHLIYFDIFITSDLIFQDSKLVITAKDFEGVIVFNYYNKENMDNYKYQEFLKRINISHKIYENNNLSLKKY